MIYNSVNIDIWTVMQWYDLIRMMKAIQKCNKKGQLLKSEGMPNQNKLRFGDLPKSSIC